MDEPLSLSELERDALKEIMNIGFGRAAATLSDVIDLHVLLSIPRIEILPAADVFSFIGNEMNDGDRFFVIEQYFLGTLKGASYLFFPEREGTRLVRILSEQDEPYSNQREFDELLREMVLEIGNIIIGACVGKIAELLGNTVTYQPPRCVSLTDKPHDGTYQFAGSVILLFQTVFSFEKENVRGFLFIATAESSLKWIREAVDAFIRRVT